MRSKRYILRALLPCAPLLVIAADGHATVPPPPTCDDLADSLFRGALTRDSRVRTEGESCIFTNVHIKTGHLAAWSIGQLTITGLKGPELNPKTRPARLQVRVEATHIVYAPTIDNARARYQIALTQRPFDVRFDVDLDFQTSHLSIREAALESPWLGTINVAFDAILEGNDIPEPSQVLGFKFSRIRFGLDNRIVFESMVMPMVLALLPQDKDPAVEIPRLQKDAERDLKRLPASAIDPASRDALIRFTRDLPHPTGHFTAEVNFPTPQPVRALIADSGKKMAWAKDTRIAAQYDR